MTPAKAIQKIKQSKTVKRQQTILHSSAVGGDSKTNVDAVQVIEGQSQWRNSHTRPSDSEAHDYVFIGKVQTQNTRSWVGEAITYRLTLKQTPPPYQNVSLNQNDGKLGWPIEILFGQDRTLLNVKGCFQSKTMGKICLCCGRTDTTTIGPTINRAHRTGTQGWWSESDTHWDRHQCSISSSLPMAW